MPKSNIANLVAVATLVIAIIGGILAGVGGTVAWGALGQQVDGNTEAIVKVEHNCEGLADKLTPAVIDLRIAVAKLTEQIESHQHTAHLHEGDD